MVGSLTGIVPATREGARRWLAIEASEADEMTKRVCRVALGAVGRQTWTNAADNLINANNTLNYGRPMVCYAAVFHWAFLAEAIKHEPIAVLFLTAKQEGVDHMDGEDRVNKKVRELIYSDIPEKRKFDINPNVPLGSMVYHGDNCNPIAHVSLSVGEGLVASCWQNNVLHVTEDFQEGTKAQWNSLHDRGFNPQTLLLPVESFGTAHLRYTKEPFWAYWQ